MIGEAELEQAIAAASVSAGVGDLFAYQAAGIDIAPVRAYGERFHLVKLESGAERREAVVGAFLLAFRLGVIAARLEVSDE